MSRDLTARQRLLLENARERIDYHLSAIAAILPPEYEVTLLARREGMPDAWIVQTNDKLELVLDLIQRAIAKANR